MSDDNKAELASAAAKLKRAKRKKSSQSEEASDNKSRQTGSLDNKDSGLVDGVINLVRKLKRDD